MTRVVTRAEVLGREPEREWMRQVLTWAKRSGWMVAHTHDSRTQEWGTDAGVPDLLLARAGSPLLLPELKAARGRVSQEQQRWLDVLAQVTTVSAPIWKPQDEARVREVLA